MKTRGSEKKERYTNGESENVREIWAETLTVNEGKIKVSDRGGEKSFSFVSEHHCQSNKDIALTEH